MALFGGNELIDPNFLLQKIGIGWGMRVADLGCGATGHFVFPAAKMVGAEGQVFAVDIQKSVLSGIESKARIAGSLNVQTIWTDLERVGAAPISSDSLDVALYINTLFQAKDHEAMLREAYRLLKQGGTLAVVEWRAHSLPFAPPSDRLVKGDIIRALAERVGFKLKETFDAGVHHYGLLFLK